MLTRNKYFITAILFMAVMFIGLSQFGCVMPRHIEELKVEIDEVKAQNEETQEIVRNLDSTVTESTQSNTKLRNDISVTVAELQRHIATLLENYNELLQKIDALNRKGVLYSSPGASQKTPSGSEQTATGEVTIEETPSIDCTLAYDDAFILMRRGEYEKAIEAFNEFIRQCPKHESVENAYYWIGESYYALEKFHEAISQFDLLINQYKSSPNIGLALYKMARSQQELGKNAKAKKTYQRLIDEYAGTFEAEQAQERLKELK